MHFQNYISVLRALNQTFRYLVSWSGLAVGKRTSLGEDLLFNCQRDTFIIMRIILRNKQVIMFFCDGAGGYKQAVVYFILHYEWF